MIRMLKSGWKTAWANPFALIVLFLYHFVWGLILYKYVASVVVPLMHRYPGGALPEPAVHLFLAEGQFRLIKTDLVQPYLWTLLGLAAFRMLMTPLLNAGVYYSLHYRQYNAGYRFFRGMKELYGPFLLYYAVQTTAILAPLFWLAPKAQEVLRSAPSYESVAMKLAPYAGCLLIYGFLLQLLTTYVQIARATGHHPLHSLPFLLRNALPAAGVTLGIAVLSATLSAVSVGASLWWAGLAALIGYQVYRFLSVFCKLWTVSSQYQLWESRQGQD